MAIKAYKPTSPGRRGMTGFDFAEVTKTKPEKGLVVSLSKQAGRNNQGVITTRHHGGGHKQKYRLIDFKRDKDGVQAKVVAIEYDPNRNARIALLHYLDGEKRYILAPLGLKVNDAVVSGPEADIKPGNALALRNIPDGTMIHGIELKPGRGAQVVRSAGAAAQLMAKEGDYASIRMPSGEFRLVPIGCKATIGQVGNLEANNVNLGKAGRTRHLGVRPTVRGSVMNPVDHPHGGGEGKSPTGGPPRTPWGKVAMGLKTRKPKASDRLIVRRRNKG